MASSAKTSSQSAPQASVRGHLSPSDQSMRLTFGAKYHTPEMTKSEIPLLLATSAMSA